MIPLVSGLALLVLLIGLAVRREHPDVHIAFMLTAFGLDLALLGWIEVTRHPMARALAPTAPSVWLHAALSLAVVTGYLTMIGLGQRLWNGRPLSRSVHRHIGTLFLALRCVDWVTTFWV
ncbi:MAG: hypothetical protein IPK07_04955 [Deltaproteobacteria bacterium]|nr:hypothetical protein [Deltaproteobacteria bacterium]